MGTKNLYENEPNLFCFFFNLMGWEREWYRFVQPNPFERFVTRLQTELVPRFVCTSDNKRQTDFARGATILHLANNTSKTQIHNYLCQECGGYRQEYGRIEVRSFLLKRRESTLAARSEMLEMLEVKDGRWFRRLDDDSPKVKWMRRVYPRVDYTQVPWTAAGTEDRCYA